MKKFLSSKSFVILSTLVPLIIGGIAGWLLGYQPNVTGEVKGWSTSIGGTTSGSTATEYIFQLKTACGFWLLALLISFLVALVCILIRKLYLQSANGENR